MFRTSLAYFCAAVIGIGGAAGCRDHDNGNGNNNNNVTTNDHTIYQVQDPGHANHLQPGDLVELERVVVTAVDKFDSGDGRTGNVWVQEPAGGAFSGVQVFAPAILPSGDINAVNVGDLVDVTGEIEEFALETDTSGRTVTEISFGTVNVLGQGDPLPAEVVSVQALISDPDAEMWEGVLVSAVNVRATDKNDQYSEVTFTGGLVADDALWDAFGAAAVDQCYGSVTGVMSYFFKYFILPRSDADLVEGQETDCASAVAEICDDGIDNDGDSFVDCADWDCQDEPACRETLCDDGLDNDGDSFIDCDDNDCLGTVACPVPTENNDIDCADGQDNDGDNLVDCEDPSCSGHPNVTVCPTETNCTDNVDNDADGFTDCDDWDCDADPACVETQCNDNVDNDGDGYTDCDDRDCWPDAICGEETGDASCTDNVDNDADGYTDCDDWSCQDTYAGCVTTETICNDNIDNDGDGYTDCDDFDCQWTPGACPGGEGDAVSCADGLDNDGDGFTDCGDFSCRCCPDEPGSNCTGFEHVATTCSPCQSP